jgi:hypothetical protein
LRRWSRLLKYAQRPIERAIRPYQHSELLLARERREMDLLRRVFMAVASA